MTEAVKEEISKYLEMAEMNNPISTSHYVIEIVGISKNPSSILKSKMYGLLILGLQAIYVVLFPL